jgi:hypothetical protein
MIWTTIFDVHDKPWREWTPVLFGMTFLFFAAKAAREAFSRNEDEYRGEVMNATETRFLGGVAICFGLILMSVAIFSAWNNSVRAIHTLDTGADQRVEGAVTHFHQTAWKGNAKDSFSVGPIGVDYTDYDALATHANVITYPGCLREGVPVRISYSGSRVLRIEIGSSAGQPRPTCRQNDAPFLLPPMQSSIDHGG